MNSTDKIVFGVVAIFTIAIFAFIVGSSLKTDKIKSNPEELIGENPHIKGNRDAKVVLIEFSDFQCPACNAFYPYVKEVGNKYSEDVAIVYKHYPLPSHNRAVFAARASEAAANQGKFWEYHDELFNNFDRYSDEDFVLYAENLGLDVEKFKEDINSDEVAQRVNDDSKQGQALSVPGTPTFYLIVDGVVRTVSIGQFSDLDRIVGEAVNEVSQN